MTTTIYGFEEMAYSAADKSGIYSTFVQQLDSLLPTYFHGTAGEAISAAYTAVYIDGNGKVSIAQADGTKQPCIGLTVESAASGASVRTQTMGYITYSSWSWTPGAKLYLSPSAPGALTETKPTSNAQIVAIAETATTILVWSELTDSILPFPSTGVTIYDTDSSHTLALKCGSDLTADRDLTFVPGDADRTITLSGDPTLNDWFDQDVKTTGSPTFAAVEISNAAPILTLTDTSAVGAADDNLIIQSVSGQSDGDFEIRVDNDTYSDLLSMTFNYDGRIGIGEGAGTPASKLEITTDSRTEEGLSIIADETINTASFTGSGLDDMTSGGTFNCLSDMSYKIEIDATGTPDTFKWSDDGGTTWNATGVAITGASQSLSFGVTVTFAATTGHTLADYWTFTATAQSANFIACKSPNDTDLFEVGGDGALTLTMDLYDEVNPGMHLVCNTDIRTSGAYNHIGYNLYSYMNDNGDYSANNTSYMRGSQLLTYVRNDFGTLSELIGTRIAYGSHGSGGADVSGTITDCYGLRILGVKKTSTTITNNYGIYVDGVDGTNVYDIYAADADAKNYFAGNIGLGTVSFGTSAAKSISVGSGTAPTSQPADIFQMWAADQAAGNCCPHIMTEDGSTIKIYQETALTAQETTITHTAPGTPDYAIQDLTNTSPYGFVTKDEGNTVLQVVTNLQTRLDELETRLQNQGYLA